VNQPLTPRPHFSSLAAAGLVFAVLIFAADADAARIRLRARAVVQVEAFRSGSDLVVRGKLADARGKPVADAVVSVSVQTEAKPDAEADHSAPATSSHGRFEARFGADTHAASARRVTVTATFSGTTTVARAVTAVSLDVAKPQPRLDVQVKPTLVTTDLRNVAVSLYAGIGDIPLARREVRLLVDGRPRAVVRTGNDGWVEQRIPTAALMPLGRHSVTAQLAETDEYNAGAATAGVEVRAALVVTLRHMPAEQPKGGKKRLCKQGLVCLEGTVKVVDPVSGGTPALVPVEKAAVTLHANKTRLTTVVVDGGRFVAALDGDAMRRRFGTGDIGIVGNASVVEPYHERGWSEIVVVRAPLPETMSQWFYAALLLLLAAGLAMTRWRDRRREQSMARELAAIAAGLPIQSVRHVGVGEAVARRLEGVILHGETGRPAPALMYLTRDGEPSPSRTIRCPAGRFSVDDLDAGAWQLAVEVDEHETLQVAFSVPHDGTYDGCELLPRSHRALVRSAFAKLVARMTGRPLDWRRETPRMVEPRWMASTRRGHVEIRDAVDEVDRALYGRPTRAAQASAAAAAMAAAEERAR